MIVTHNHKVHVEMSVEETLQLIENLTKSVREVIGKSFNVEKLSTMPCLIAEENNPSQLAPSSITFHVMKDKKNESN